MTGAARGSGEVIEIVPRLSGACSAHISCRSPPGVNGRTNSSTSASPAGSAPQSRFSAAWLVGACGCAGGSVSANGTNTAGWSDQPRPTPGRSRRTGDAGGAQLVRRADSRAQQQQRGGHRAGGQHHLTGRDDLTVEQLDADRALAVEGQPGHRGVAAHGEVRPVLAQVGHRRADPHPVDRVGRDQPGPRRTARVLVRLGGEAEPVRRAQQALRGRVQQRAGRAADRHRAVLAVQRPAQVEVGLGAR